MKSFKIRKEFNPDLNKWELSVKYEGYIPTAKEWEQIENKVNIEKLPKKKYKIVNI